MQGAKHLWIRVYTSFYRRITAYSRPVPLEDPPNPPREDFRPGMLDEHELEEYLQLRKDQKPAEIRRRLEEGQKCIVVRHRGLLVHAIWAAVDRVYIPYLDGDLLLGKRDIYIADNFTLREYRRCGLTDLRMPLLWNCCREAGKTRAISLVAVENRQGNANTRSKGYREWGQYRQLRIGPFRSTWARSDSGEPLLPLAPKKSA